MAEFYSLINSTFPADRTPGLITDPDFKNSAVCITLIDTEEGPSILFEKRTSKYSQPGDICFPGGRIDKGEKPEEAALREICEELLVSPENVEFIGPADIMHTVNIMIHPFVMKLSGYKGTYSENEVAEVFTVPVEFFMNYEEESYITEYPAKPQEGFPYDSIVGGKNYKWIPKKEKVYFYRYKDKVIWGLTAKMMHSFTEMLKNSEGTLK